MAFDTAEKRRSASALYPPFGVGVTPIGSPVDQEWRQQAGWGYSGVVTEVGVPPPVTAQGFQLLTDGQFESKIFGGLVIR